MSSSMCRSLAALALFTAQAARGAHYPSALESRLEHLLVDTAGYNSGSFYDGITPCSRYVSIDDPNLGRTTSAQWMRVAFHDFATADIEAGTGGLDASIVYEYTRPENSGAAFLDSFNYWVNYVDSRTSLSDVIALGTVAAITSCGGPKLVYSAGRVDARKAGISGVPEPESSITETLNRMKAAGLSQTDSITLTACGHTVGRIHHAGFPQVVPESYVTPNNTGGGVDLDGTYTVYDNTIAFEYIEDRSTNMLVVSPNVTVRSDLRMFSSDNNATMAKFSQDAELFASECRRVTTQMLNTVPKGVNLKEISPIAVKPLNVTLTVDSSGETMFSGTIRLLGSQFSSNADRQVAVTYKTPSGEEVTIRADTLSSLTGSSAYLDGAETYYYTFSVPIANTSGVNSFSVSTVESSNAKPVNTTAFAFQDSVAFLPAQSSLHFDTASGKLSGALSAAIKAGVGASAVQAIVKYLRPTDSPNPSQETFVITFTSSASLGTSGYDLYQAAVDFTLPNGTNATLAAPLMATGLTFDVVATLSDGQTVTDDYRTAREASFTYT